MVQERRRDPTGITRRRVSRRHGRSDRRAAASARRHQGRRSSTAARQRCSRPAGSARARARPHGGGRAAPGRRCEAGPRYRHVAQGLAGRVAAVAAEFRTTLKAGGPHARRLLQRVLNGRRVPCEPFRESGRRGYRFSAEEIPYSGLLCNEIGGPNGIRTRVSALRGPCPRPLDDGAAWTKPRGRLAGGGGFEPPLPGPEPGVLPLDDPPPTSAAATNYTTACAARQRTAVFSARLGRKRATRAAGSAILAPVLGCRPGRATRRHTTNVPNPLIVTDRPRRSSSTISAMKVFIARSAEAREPPEAFARMSTSSDLVTKSRVR